MRGGYRRLGGRGRRDEGGAWWGRIHVDSLMIREGIGSQQTDHSTVLSLGHRGCPQTVADRQ